MAVATYDDLKTTIARYSWRAGSENETQDDTFAAEIPTFIQLAETRLNNNRAFRLGDMVKRVTLPVVGNEAVLPDDYLQYRAIRHNANQKFLSETDDPRADGFQIVGSSTIHVQPVYSGDLTLEYYAAIPPLSEANQTNWLLSRSFDIYLYGSLLEAMPFTGEDNRAGTWHAYYDKAVQNIIGRDVLARYARTGTQRRAATP